MLALQKGRLGEKYNIGGFGERQNIDVVDRICDALETLRPASANAALKAKVFRTTADAFCRRFITALETPTLRRAA